jgi:hypothetical protein
VKTYLVGFVVVLRIVFEDFLFFMVLKCSGEIFHTAAKAASPFFALDEPEEKEN